MTLDKNSQASELGKTIARNAVFVTLGSVALKAINFLFSVYIVRRLGDDRFGQYTTVLAFVGLFQIFAELGMSQYVMREIARDRSKAPAYFWNLVTVRLLLAFAGIAIIWLFAALTGYPREIVIAIFIYTISFALAAFQAPLEAVLTAHERLGTVSTMGVLGQVTFVVLGGAFMLSGLSFTWLIVASVLSIIPVIALAAWTVRSKHVVSLPFRIDPRTWPGLVKSGLPFGIISLALTITFSLDTVLLSKFVTNDVVGWYNAAYRLSMALLFFFNGFSVAVVPSLSRTYIEDAEAVERWYYRSVKFILMLSVPIAVGGMLVAFPLIRFLYTDEFLPAASALQIIIWDMPILMFTSFCGNMTTVVGEERSAARIYMLAAVTNIATNLFAIPRYGYLGAAATTVLTDLVAAVLFYRLLSRKLKLPNLLPIAARVLAACLVMAGVVVLLRGVNLFVMVAAGAVTYLVLALLLRMLDENEWGLIRRLLRGFRSQPADNL
jgi:O-antigen/teichoic acid export membrane protein